MKKSVSIFFLLFFMLSCAHNENKTSSGNSVKKEIMEIAINYARDKFEDSKQITAGDGIIIIGNDQIKYIIDPGRIVTGLIDDDKNDDAIVSITSYKGQYLFLTEHLFLIKTDGKLMLNRVIESDMKIMGIKDRIITVEISKVAPDSPLDGCERCKEIVKYQFKNGDLIKME